VPELVVADAADQRVVAAAAAQAVVAGAAVEAVVPGAAEEQVVARERADAIGLPAAYQAIGPGRAARRARRGVRRRGRERVRGQRDHECEPGAAGTAGGEHGLPIDRRAATLNAIALGSALRVLRPSSVRKRGRRLTGDRRARIDSGP
jgi:hypothetical protein